MWRRHSCGASACAPQRSCSRLEPYGNDGSEFHDGLLEIDLSDGRYIDRTGKVVIDEVLYRRWDFSEGLAAAMRKDGALWGYIDTSGKFAIANPRSKRVRLRRATRLGQDVGNGGDRFWYIDREGNRAIHEDFARASRFFKGLAHVETIPNGNTHRRPAHAYIDAKGRRVFTY